MICDYKFLFYDFICLVIYFVIYSLCAPARFGEYFKAIL